MTRTVVLNVVGLAPALIGTQTPQLARWATTAGTARIRSAFPAVTCTAQSDYLTGQPPSRHGIVGNGWYAREDCEIRFWKQANTLVQAPKVWDAARAIDPGFTVANLFWWFNMYSSADYSVTPRPMYPADGRKLPDIYTHPPTLRHDLQGALGTFPLFEFWGPRAGIRCTQWIAEAAKRVEQARRPTLTLVYLPHLDYNLQRLGVSNPAIGEDLRAVDAVTGDLIRFYEERGVQVIVLSEYGLTDVSRPVHLNRMLRERGWLVVRDEQGLDMLDPGASPAFAVADHQVAHIYVNDRARLHEIRSAIAETPGVDRVLDAAGKAGIGIDHPRAGDLVAIASPDAWFTYYYWLDDRRAPDYARTVDIHRKPGYDPVELFMDPALRMPAATVGWKLLKRKLGFRNLLDVIPLDASLVRGSHGRADEWSDHGPLLMTRTPELVGTDHLHSVDVHDVILRHLTGLSADRDLQRDSARRTGAYDLGQGARGRPTGERDGILPGAVDRSDGAIDAELHELAARRDWTAALARIVTVLSADSGTLHLIGPDGALHLAAASAGIPAVVLDAVRTVPVGKGMAGLAVLRRQPVNACNIQTDTSGDVRPGARATGLQGSVVVPLLRDEAAVGALGVATRSERTFTTGEEALLIRLGRILADGVVAERPRTQP